MAQVAATAFGIPLDRVSISDTATDKVANASATAASASSDLNGMAILDACNQILARLAPLRAQHPHKSWSELCSTAYFERIGLGATGFYATPNVGYDFVKAEGTPFGYFTICCQVVHQTLVDGHQLVSGDIDAGFAAAEDIIGGEARIGGQEHHYFETMQCIITPGEDDEIHVLGTTQNPNKTQAYIARTLGIQAHKVVVNVSINQSMYQCMLILIRSEFIPEPNISRRR